MADQTIKCPNCGTQIPLTEALTGQIEQSMKLKYEAETAEKAKELDKEKTVLKQKAKELEAKGQAIDEQVAEQLKTERKEIAEAERKKILAEHSEQTKALEEELVEKSKKLSDMQRQEIDLRKKQRELEQKQQELELENQRKLDQERKKISEEASKKATEEQQLKMREKDDQLTAMKKQIDELKRKAEVGSQQAAGEALEENLQDVLQQNFPFDQFEEIKKGQRGADILQRVRNTSGKLCGSILWESKNTKDFNKAWIPKLRQDQQDAKADIAVIVSVTLPKEIENFGRQDDIWISNFKSTIGLATLLRQLLIEVTRQKLISAGQTSMKDLIYEYVTGQEFSLHIKAVISAFGVMLEDLQKEKRAVALIWKKREKQISTVLTNVAGMKGSIEGLAQKTLPEAEMLSLETIVDEEETD